jgi:hypothetical protein
VFATGLGHFQAGLPQPAHKFAPTSKRSDDEAASHSHALRQIARIEACAHTTTTTTTTILVRSSGAHTRMARRNSSSGPTAAR